MPRKTEYDTYSANLKAAWPPGCERAGKRRVGKPAPKVDSDALVRLEKWISAQEPRRHRMVGYIALLDGGKSWRVNIGLSSHGFWGSGSSLPDAIHAALDQAGAEK